MKLTKLLAALAVPAMFAACTQEELFKVDNTPQEMDKVVGAKLVGTDVSLNAYVAGSESATRFAGGNKYWENGDIVGLGWLITEDGVKAEQKENKTPESPLYANHMYEYDEVVSKWGTKGNIYEGWYFGYYPWSYEKVAGKMKSYVLNPGMLAVGSAYQMSQTLYLTNRQFIDAEEDLDVETNTLKPSFEMYQAVKFIQVTTNAEAGSAFADDKKEGGLDEYPIKSVSISIGDESSKIFAESVRLSAKNLPVKVEYDKDATDEQKAATDMLNLKNFREAYNKFMYDPVWKNIVERNVEKAKYTVSTKDAKVYFNVVPGIKAFDAKDVVIKVNTGSASFIIKGNDEKLSATNKAAIETLVNAYKEGGVLSTINELDAAGNPLKNLSVLKLSIELCDENYETDFTSISDFEEWKDAINDVNTLKLSEATFNIDGDIEFTESVLMPESAKLTVTTNDNAPKMIVLKSGTFGGISENLNVNAVEVKVDAAATVDNAQTISAKAVLNYGTLNIPAYTKEQEDLTNPEFNVLQNVVNNEGGEINLLGYYAKVADVDNSQGRINVVYGSFVELKDGTEAGEIAYQVLDDDVTNPKNIQTVINTENTVGVALVNILTFDAEKLKEDKFDFTLTKQPVGGSKDPYNPTPGTTAEDYTFDGIENVSLEIFGVEVKSSTKEITVNNVVISNGKIVSGIKIGGDLTVDGGVNIVNTTEIGGKLEITNGTGQITTNIISGGVTITEGNYTINAGSIEGGITAEGENYFNVETITGDVKLTNTSMNATNLSGATITGNVELKGGEFLLENVNVTGNVTVTSGTVKMLNVNISGALTNNGTVYVFGEAAAIGSIDNKGTLNANTDVTVSTIIVNKNSSVTVADEKTIWYTTPKNEGGYIQKGTTTGVVEYKGADAVVAELKAAIAEGGDVTLVADVTLDEPLTISGNVVLNLNGKTITAKNCSAIKLDENALLTIGGGSVKAEKNAIYSLGGSVIINSGTYTSTGENMAAIYCAGTNDENGKAEDYPWNITINGGTFISEQQSAVVLYNNYYGLEKEGKAVLNGGTFNGKLYDLYVGYAKVTIEEECDFTNDVFYIEKGSIINGGSAYTEDKKVESFDEL